MKIASTLALLVSAASFAACGTTQSTSNTASLTHPHPVVTDSATKQVLGAGEYLVTFARQESCRTVELNLKKELKMNAGTDALPEVIVSSAGPVSDNLMHAMFCMETPPLSHGTLRLNLTATTSVEALASDGLTIQSIQQIDEEVNANFAAGALLPVGDYIVDVTGDAGCSNKEFNINKSLIFGANQSLTIQLASNGFVLDDVIRPMVCILNATASASVYVKTTEPATLTGAGDLKITNVSQITATHAINLQ